MHPQHLTLADRCLIALDTALTTLHARTRRAERPYPAPGGASTELGDGARRHAAALMRVNHAGEIAAQALYHGQALTAREAAVQGRLYQAAGEENDHLAWCERRLHELGSRPSRLAPLWYCGSLTIGALAGLAGDKWSLGFIAETENQVVEHLDGHFSQLPEQDAASRKVIAQMRRDEARHASEALKAGGESLPSPVKKLMQGTAKIMTSTAYYV